MNEVARLLIIIGFVLILIGLAFYVFGRIPGLGKLPGDIFIKRDNFTFYFPIATSILISIVLSILVWLWNQK